ncbi:MAG: TonB-dependent receptor [Rubrivivax sp.]
MILRARTPVAARPRLALLPLLLSTIAPALAQTAPTPTIVVTGNPLGREALLRADSALSGDALLLRAGSTLGDTLATVPGTAAGGFGPNATRPVIRGLDGERVRLLDNGGASIDASSLSFDHAVATDPLVAERIEVLRGPAALLYGGNATGGVVNSLDNRIPRSPQSGLTARTEWRLGGAARERSAAAVLDGGAGALAWHADAYGRRSADLQVPRFTPPADGDEPPDTTTRVRNSASRSEGGAAGLSWTGADGHLGLSLDTHRQHYGVVVEPEVTIRLQRERLALAGERRRLDGPFEQVEASASSTRYRHEELEGSGEVGTTFRSRGEELRLQARHRALGPWRGVLGLQLERLRFSALGEEAFVPGTLTRSQALFALEEGTFGAWRVQAGARAERVRVRSDGDVDDALAPRFGAAQERRFGPRSASLASSWQAGGGWALGASVAHTERAPAYHELFANGAHVATAAYERGDPALGVERSRGVQATLEWRRGPDQARLSLHDTRFSRYLSLAATGEAVSGPEGDALPVYEVRPVRAQLRGLELESRWRVATAPAALDLTAQAETLRGQDLDRGQPLPRIAPARVLLGAEAVHDRWSAGLSMRAVAAQRRVDPLDRPTPGYTLWNAWAAWRLSPGPLATTLFARLDNLGDRLATQAVAVPTVRERSPLGGRSLLLGLRVQL